MNVVYVVAASQDDFLRWIGKQDPDGNDPDPLVSYRLYRPDVGTRGRDYSWLFLKGWQRCPEWRQAYNRAIANGKRWWER